ncbi:30S ribosomal protein S30 [Salegentibacter salinarum]|uniref:30S ribosomal protein S30 n=1 Tax=Salegentibacter salinarum TaxID=447422 RepID=A0A2N0U2U5_9FLAO|nr:HPF/RaiA family ribosome-associated protein [Salegentibacter salinarum]PKD21198.1 30S ribosomal protein S30 [Salegentibacter salinarum]SKB75796.1 putative sigma-54 modulation protein [Salegentibacter salinarum]
MLINIQFIKTKGSEFLTQNVSKNLNKLSDKYDWLIKAEVYFKEENDPTGRSKICEIELSAPGPRIFASSTEESFELAIKKTIFELDQQLKKRKAVFVAH